jgi:hypothetical protein
MGESKNPEFHCYRVVRCWKHKDLVTPRHNRLTGMGLQAITTATTSSANGTRGHGLRACTPQLQSCVLCTARCTREEDRAVSNRTGCMQRQALRSARRLPLSLSPVSRPVNHGTRSEQSSRRPVCFSLWTCLGMGGTSHDFFTKRRSTHVFIMSSSQWGREPSPYG